MGKSLPLLFLFFNNVTKKKALLCSYLTRLELGEHHLAVHIPRSPIALCGSCHHHISFCPLGVFSVLRYALLYLRPSCLPVSSTVCLFDKMLVVSSRCISLKNVLNLWNNIPFPQYKHIFTHVTAASSPFSIASG